MDVEFSAHAKQRLRQRRISEGKVLQVILELANTSLVRARMKQAHEETPGIQKIPRQLAARSLIESPDKTDFSFRNRWIYRKKYGDIILEVVIIKEDRKLVVVTAYYL